VILMAVRWYLAHPLSGTSVMVLLAERGIDVSPRTVLRWVQTFGPLLAAEVRKHRRRPGTTWYVDEVFFFRKGGEEKRYLYRAIDEHGQVLDVLFRDHRDTASAEAFFRRTLGTTGVAPTSVVSDHHQPYIAAAQEVFPTARHVRTGLHRARGETTKPIERSHVATRDRLRSSRGLKTLATGQRFFEGFEALHALYRGHVHLEHPAPGYPPAGATRHECARAAVTALRVLGTRLPRPA
jgi:transposase-like protein